MSYDLVLDVRAKDCNRNPRFRPLAGNLKTEDRADQIHSDKVNGDMARIQVIPGYRLEIDVEGKKARIIDRLKQPEHAGVLKALRACMRNPERYRGEKPPGEKFEREDCIPENEFDLDGEAPMNVATWLWHCFTMVRSGNLHVVKGRLPGSDDIRRMGVIWLSDNNGIQSREGKRPWHFMYPDEVERESRKPAAAGKGA